jgi:hypothetical protein
MNLIYPLEKKGTKTSGFGNRIHPVKKKKIHHNGIDIGIPNGTSVRAVADGEVVRSDMRDKNGYGNFIIIKHNLDGKTKYSCYAHLTKRLVDVGDKVTQGEEIAKSGGGQGLSQGGGMTTGPHLHFEIRNSIKGDWENPEPYISNASVTKGVSYKKQDTTNTPGTDGKITQIGYDNFPADEKELIGLLFDGFKNGGIDNRYAKIALASLVLYKTKSGEKSSYKGSTVEQEVKNMMSEIGSKDFKTLDEALEYLQAELGSEFNKTEVKKIANKFTAKVETAKGESSIFDIGKVFSYLKNFTKDLFEDEEEVTNLKEDVQRINDIMKKIL